MTDNPTRPAKARRLLIEVADNGAAQPPVRVPLAVARLGMRMGRIFGGKAAAEALDGVDLDAVLAAIDDEADELPLLLTEVGTPDGPQHVRITIE